MGNPWGAELAVMPAGTTRRCPSDGGKKKGAENAQGLAGCEKRIPKIDPRCLARIWTGRAPVRATAENVRASEGCQNN